MLGGGGHVGRRQRYFCIRRPGKASVYKEAFEQKSERDERSPKSIV